jgi:hypothetical protein
MNDQIMSVYRKSYFHISRIARIRKYRPRSSAAQLVHALVTSTLDYGNSLLVRLSAKRLLILQRVQNFAARVVYGVRDVESIIAVLNSLHWLPIESRIVFKIAMLTYHCLNGSGPIYPSSLLCRRRSPYAPRPTEAFDLFVPRTRLKTFSDRAFASAAPRIWCSLPLSVKSCDSLSSFRSSLKAYLFKMPFITAESDVFTCI